MPLDLASYRANETVHQPVEVIFCHIGGSSLPMVVRIQAGIEERLVTESSQNMLDVPPNNFITWNVADFHSCFQFINLFVSPFMARLGNKCFKKVIERTELTAVNEGTKTQYVVTLALFVPEPSWDGRRFRFKGISSEYGLDGCVGILCAWVAKPMGSIEQCRLKLHIPEFSPLRLGLIA